MRDVSFPSTAKIQAWQLAIEGHTRGASNTEGAGMWSRGSGAMFVGSVSIAAMTHENALALRAFLHSLRGRGGSFNMTIPSTEGLAVGTATLTGAAALGATTATLSSITSSSLLVAGAYATIGTMGGTGQLVQLVSVSGSDIVFRPQLRAAQSLGAAVNFGRVQGIFRLTGKTPVVAIRPALCFGISLEFEDFR